MATLYKGCSVFQRIWNRQLFNERFKHTSRTHNRRFFDFPKNWNGQLFPKMGTHWKQTHNRRFFENSNNRTTLVQGTGLMMKWKEQTIEKMGFTFLTTSYIIIIIPFCFYEQINGVVLNIEALPWLFFKGNDISFNYIFHANFAVGCCGLANLGDDIGEEAAAPNLDKISIGFRGLDSKARQFWMIPCIWVMDGRSSCLWKLQQARPHSTMVSTTSSM